MRILAVLSLLGLLVEVPAFSEAPEEEPGGSAFPPRARPYVNHPAQTILGLAEAVSAPMVSTLRINANQIVHEASLELLYLRRELTARMMERYPAHAEFFRREQIVRELGFKRLTSPLSAPEALLWAECRRMVAGYPQRNRLAALLKQAEDTEPRAFFYGRGTLTENFEAHRAYARALRRFARLAPWPLLLDGAARLHAVTNDQKPGYFPLGQVSAAAWSSLAGAISPTAPASSSENPE